MYQKIYDWHCTKREQGVLYIITQLADGHAEILWDRESFGTSLVGLYLVRWDCVGWTPEYKLKLVPVFQVRVITKKVPAKNVLDNIQIYISKNNYVSEIAKIFVECDKNKLDILIVNKYLFYSKRSLPVEIVSNNSYLLNSKRSPFFYSHKLKNFSHRNEKLNQMNLEFILIEPILQRVLFTKENWKN